MKIKTCKWLDGNIWGGLHMLSGQVLSCCAKSSKIMPQVFDDFSQVSAEQIIEARKEFIKKMNETNICDGCPMIVEKEEDEIDCKKIDYLSFGNFSSCNLRCKYCYFSDEELSKPVTKMQKRILPFLKECHNAGMLKPDFTLGLAGGEPLLFEDIIESAEFIAQNYDNPKLVLLSNSSISKNVEKYAPLLGKLPKNLQKLLYTSIDAGTRETYKLVRKRDLFDDVTNNLLLYAQHNSFDKILLKYMLLGDGSNLEDKDIFGFLDLMNKVNNSANANLQCVIDRDSFDKSAFDGKILDAAAKIYYVSREIFFIMQTWGGTSLNAAVPNDKKNIAKVIARAEEYKYSEKTEFEKRYLEKFKKENIKSQNFIKGCQNKVNDAASKYNNPRVLIYGGGMLAQTLFENCDFSQLNIKAVSDIRFDGTETFFGFKTIKPDDIKNEDYDIIIFTLYRNNEVFEFLRNKGITIPFLSLC